jgi:glycosyltransferase involved in cell wall biosynthesis
MLKTLKKKPLSVAMFSRAKHTGYYSIEKVFQTIQAAMPEHIDARVIAPPLHAQGLWRRLLCLLYAGMHQSTVNHITGDISFAAMALPGDRTIVTVHDFDRLYRLSGLRGALFRTVYFTMPFRRCRYITTISAQIARELGQLFPWAVPKLVVIPDCLPGGFHRIPRAFNVQRPVILQIGTKANKNLESLIQALRGQRCELHVVGLLSKQQRSLLEQCAVPYRNSADISESELLKAYAEADIVSFVSTYEGFGLPILEGNAVGRPVITSSLPPMSDVAGQAACLVDPYSIPAIREGIAKIIADPGYRTDLVNRGFENIRRYSATEIARQFAALYETVAGGPAADGLIFQPAAAAPARIRKVS